MDFLKIKSATILFLQSKYYFTFVQLLSEIFQLFINLVSFQFKEVICVVKNDNHHFILNLLQLDLSVIVKFCYFVEFIPEDISVFNAIHVNVKIHLKDSPLNQVSNTF